MDMCSKRLYILLSFFYLILTNPCSAQQLAIVKNKRTDYTIVLPAKCSQGEQKAAALLQSCIQRITGVALPLAREGNVSVNTGLFIGNTRRAATVINTPLPADSYRIQAVKQDIIICGGTDNSLSYGVCCLLEHYLGCTYLAASSLQTPASDDVYLPADLREDYQASFIYREVYYPSALDSGFRAWHHLQQLDDLWGIWGHSYDKLVPAEKYFKSHPEYFALVDGERQTSQLCLSNEAVFNIAVATLREKIMANPAAQYWSVSPNDDIGYCECSRCKKVDNMAGSPAGSLVKFVNRIAATFPQKKFTTLAYSYTHRAPRGMVPAANVYIFLSDIDAFRDQSLSAAPSAEGFRNDLKEWSALTPNIFIWDYLTQFTNYLAPFPNFHTLQANVQLFKAYKVKGIFAQGSGDTHSEWADLRAYLTARLMEDDRIDLQKTTLTFLTGFYGPAAPFLQQYINALQANMLASGRRLDIYGNPVNEWSTYLSLPALATYRKLFDKAEAATAGNRAFNDRVITARLPLDYTALQQARFYGIEPFGIFTKSSDGVWTVKAGMAEKIRKFTANCKKAGVKELSEGGLTPDQYQAEWNVILAAGVTRTMALGAEVTLKQSFAPEYPAKGNQTLVDGNPGYGDFNYNWLCFYGTPMEAVIDLGEPKEINSVSMHFLDDPRHRIFLPASISIYISDDGVRYNELAVIKSQDISEHYEVSVKEFSTRHRAKARYIKVVARNLAALPRWRYKSNKKPMIACDEVYVQ